MNGHGVFEHRQPPRQIGFFFGRSPDLKHGASSRHEWGIETSKSFKVVSLKSFIIAA